MKTAEIRVARACPSPRSQSNPASTEAEQAPLAVRRAWAALIKRVYEVDPLVCPACGGRTAILALIEQKEGIFPILRRLGLLADRAEARDPPA